MTTKKELLETIEYVGRTIGQLQDVKTFSKAIYGPEALSRAMSALGGTYYKATGKPLEWWQGEYLETANGLRDITNT